MVDVLPVVAPGERVSAVPEIVKLGVAGTIVYTAVAIALGPMCESGPSAIAFNVVVDETVIGLT